MTVRAEEAEAALIAAVCGRVQEEVPPDLVDQANAFVRQYYHLVPREDLASRSESALFGAAMAHWAFARERAPGSASVRAYNPRPEEHGWSSPHTVVEIVTDDMPFLVDSVAMELVRRGYGINLLIHPVLEVQRDTSGQLAAIFLPGAEVTGAFTESLMQVEIDREPDRARLETLVAQLREVLDDVRAAVEDWPNMRTKVREIVRELERPPAPLDEAEVAEGRAFLEWVDANDFIFLGYRDYDLVKEGGESHLRAVEGSGLGILRGEDSAAVSASFAKLPSDVRALAHEPQLLTLTKADSRSTVHRPLYLDYIGVKRFDGGNVSGERRFLGLYTSAAEKASPREIPILRGKVDRVVRRAAFTPGSHDAKALLETLETYPRDELFQIGDDDLFETAMGIVSLGERQRVRLFVRRDPYRRFVSCLVFIPRDRFNTENRERLETALREAYQASQVDWRIQLSESILVRLHYIVHCPAADATQDPAPIERRINELTRPWVGDLHGALREAHGEERGDALFRVYADAFSAAYRADTRARSAVVDIARAEALAGGEGILLDVYEPAREGYASVRCRLISPGERIALSDVLPIFEDMGLRVGDERPYEVTPRGRGSTWIYDFGLGGEPDGELRSDAARERFAEAFTAVWDGGLESDRLSSLVLSAGLSGRDVSVLRALVSYLRQAGTTFTDRYLQEALAANPTVARLLVALFRTRADPVRRDTAAAERLVTDIEAAVDETESLDQDRILRNVLTLVQATLRTNYFQPGDRDRPKPYLAFKFDPSALAFLPQPRPRFEIFVYSPRVEGIHLRGGSVARGGIRWSDRREDFRSEVLDLMKAQMVKNAVIVPVGAKGGFIVKRPPGDGDALRAEVANCYRTFISGLLDLTDNIEHGEIIPPPATVAHDDDDTYLVVAADKGTASFSDLANEIAEERGFWLGDAFASGGSQGYDHKKMGITARGAWESVKRHFRELGVNVSAEDFTVVGIGDMSGDVFGNGMLLSEHISLVGAFDHRHIFIDPAPDPKASFAERKRLFELPRSSWSDYDSSVISEGGGVFSRSAKRIELSARARTLLGIEAEKVDPAEVVRALLRAEVDLLWNGGVGTFVKASSETHADVGDKANDVLRVDAPELRCRVVGEGGNLGLTQRARIEYALAGGRLNTDAIDNVAGVNTSDHEVNLKILLDGAVADGRLAPNERNELLASLTDVAAARVLARSYSQSLGLALERRQAPALLDLHARMIQRLEHDAHLDRALEALPDEAEIRERRSERIGLTAPELSLLVAYAKITLDAALLHADVPEDDYFRDALVDSFPPPLPDRFRPEMRAHRLRREIIATDVANNIVDSAGPTFAFRLIEETGASAAHVARAYAVAVDVFELKSFWRDVEALDDQVDADVQAATLLTGRRLLTRAARWLIRNRGEPIAVEAAIADYKPAARALRDALPDLLTGAARDAWSAQADELARGGVPNALAELTAGMDAAFSALEVVEVGGRDAGAVARVSAVHFGLGDRLGIRWLLGRILALPRPDLWQTLARAALRDDLYETHRALTAAVIALEGEDEGAEQAIEAWVARNEPQVRRCADVLDELRKAEVHDVTRLSVAVREVGNLVPTPVR